MSSINEYLGPVCCDVYEPPSYEDLKPVCVDILTDLRIALKKYSPIKDGKLVYPLIVNYLHRIGFVYDEYEGYYLKLNSSGLYDPMSKIEIEKQIYGFINSCNPLFNVDARHVNSIIRNFNAEYNRSRLESDFSQFLGTDLGMDYDFDFRFKNSSLIQLSNGVFHPHYDWDGYSFKLLPNCGLYYPPNGNFPYDLYFSPIPEAHIFDECTPYDHFLTILGDHDTVKFFLWWAGAVLFSYPFSLQMFLLLYGSPGSGKNSIIECLASILGRATSYSSLTGLIDDRKRAGLMGKRLNVSSELEGQYDKRLTSTIKEITGGTQIQVDPKFLSPRSIHPPALVFTGNAFPEIDTSDGAIMRRVCAIHCTANLEEETTENWISIMKDNEHKNWLFNASYYVWMKNKDKRPSHMKSKAMFEIESRMNLFNPFVSWISEYFETTDKKIVKDKICGRALSDLHDSYCYYVRELGGIPLGRNRFSEKIQNDYRLELKAGHSGRVFRPIEENRGVVL